MVLHDAVRARLMASQIWQMHYGLALYAAYLMFLFFLRLADGTTAILTAMFKYLMAFDGVRSPRISAFPSALALDVAVPASAFFNRHFKSLINLFLFHLIIILI